MKPLVKTSGSKISTSTYRSSAVRSEGRLDVRKSAGSPELSARNASLMTSEYRVAKRPRGRVLVDYNQNAWGRTPLPASTLRPRPEATVSTPLAWKKSRLVPASNFWLDNVRADRARRRFMKPLLAAKGRTDLKTFLTPHEIANRLEIFDVIAIRALTATSIGTASSVPQIPQTKLRRSA